MSKGIDSLADLLADGWTMEVMRRRLTENQWLVLFKVFHEITGDLRSHFCNCRRSPLPIKTSPKS
ncbi:MAG: hypothetical protein LDL41_00280 [Coleofasciculus sp. S288]|nr:hypothetical protein [Coleofasciculus sp. S288]